MSGKIHGPSNQVPKNDVIDQKVFERNLQQVGSQRESISKKELEKSASAEDFNSSLVDYADIAKSGQDAGMQTGIMQNQAKTKVQDAVEPEVPVNAQPAPPVVMQDSSAGSGSPAPAPPGVPSTTPATDAATKQKAVQDDLQQANQIFWQMSADRMKWQQRILAILADTQTEIFKMWQEVMARRQKTMSDIADKWAAVLGGYDK